jgi:ATP-binding cassette subfamily C (CFTR/MRP) protein 5
LKKLLDHIEDDWSSIEEGIWWTFALFISELIRASCFAIMYAISIRTAIRTSSGLSTILYNKLLISRSPINKTVGEMVNLFANDTTKIFHMVYILPLTIGGPIVTIVTIAYTWWLLGLFALVGVLIFIFIFGLQFGIAKTQSYYRKKAIEMTDERISALTELLTFIKLIKLYAWERPFSENIIGNHINEIY